MFSSVLVSSPHVHTSVLHHVAHHHLVGAIIERIIFLTDHAVEVFTGPLGPENLGSPSLFFF